MTTILNFLDPLEQIQMQLVDTWMYKVAISRVQVRYQLHPMLYVTGTQSFFRRHIMELRPRKSSNFMKIHTLSTKNRMLQRTVVAGKTKFIEVAKAPMMTGREFPAFCNMKNVAIVVSGG